MTRILGFDPGEEHTGWALVINGKLHACGELEGWQNVEALIKGAYPHRVVAEDFRLYPGKARAQSGSQLYTARVLGVIEFLCEKWAFEFHLQMASRIRDDPKVKDLKTDKGRHADDAFKHAMAFYLANYTDTYRAKH